MSTLLADTIRKTGGTAGVDIRVKNNSVYESDGGTSVTQNMVQSLAKVWCNADQTGTVRDSLNISGITDEGTGDVTFTFSNAVSNDDYALTGSCRRAATTTEGFVFQIHTLATGSCRARHMYIGQQLYDHDHMCMNIHGDLA